MEKQINGKRYEFSIKLSKRYFEIVAIRKQDHKHSAITNLNCIIGEIVEPILKTNDIQDSIIKVNESDGLKLLNLAMVYLKDEKIINYLENQLDEDFELTDFD